MIDDLTMQKITKQRNLLTFTTRDGFEVNALLVTPNFETEKELYENPKKRLDLILEGKALEFEQKPSLGCNIKWK